MNEHSHTMKNTHFSVGSFAFSPGECYYSAVALRLYLMQTLSLLLQF